MSLAWEASMHNSCVTSASWACLQGRTEKLPLKSGWVPQLQGEGIREGSSGGCGTQRMRCRTQDLAADGWGKSGDMLEGCHPSVQVNALQYTFCTLRWGCPHLLKSWAAVRVPSRALYTPRARRLRPPTPAISLSRSVSTALTPEPTLLQAGTHRMKRSAQQA